MSKRGSHSGTGPRTAWRPFQLALLALVAALVLTPVAQAQDSGTGIVEGQVVNGTAGAEQPGAGITVNLYVLRADLVEEDIRIVDLYEFRGELAEESISTVTDADGHFQFEGLDTSPDSTYWVEAVYQDVPYASAGLLQYDEGQTDLEATVTVYETTEDDSGVQLGLVHIFADSLGPVLRIYEVHLFGSSDDRTYIGEQDDQGRRLTVFVPVAGDRDTFALGEATDADRFLAVEGGLVDSEPVRPGIQTSRVQFSYHLTVTGKPITLERYFAYPVGYMTVLVAQPGLLLSSPQLQSMGTQATEDTQYEILQGQVPDPEQPLVLELTAVEVAEGSMGAEASASQTASGAPAGSAQKALLWIGVATAILVVFALAFLAARVLGQSAGRRTVSDPGQAFDPKARRLIAALADLEDGYEAGEVDEADYVRQRMEIFRELG